MERSILTFSVANIVTVNLMVLIMGFALAYGLRAFRGRSDA